MPLMKPIRCLTEEDEAAVWILWEYIANEKNDITKRFLEPLAQVAEILNISDEIFEAETGMKIEKDEDTIDWDEF